MREIKNSRYGIPYQGSKRSIAHKLLEQMLERVPRARYFVDLFGGGGEMSAFSQALAIAIACIFSFGLVAHKVLSSLVEQKFSELELSILKTRSEVIETQAEIKRSKK